MQHTLQLQTALAIFAVPSLRYCCVSYPTAGDFIAEEGMFLSDEWIGSVMGCTVEQARAAAAEADHAAQMAQVFELRPDALSSPPAASKPGSQGKLAAVSIIMEQPVLMPETNIKQEPRSRASIIVSQAKVVGAGIIKQVETTSSHVVKQAVELSSQVAVQAGQLSSQVAAQAGNFTSSVGAQFGNAFGTVHSKVEGLTRKNI